MPAETKVSPIGDGTETQQRGDKADRKEALRGWSSVHGKYVRGRRERADITRRARSYYLVSEKTHVAHYRLSLSSLLCRCEGVYARLTFLSACIRGRYVFIGPNVRAEE
ncbi:hypothetical protein PAXRUDRAFT_827804 [Paxillus rubicundulus Ve08.2h10]|uniref:Uncharacterized protein n=1 Tax=Paxillus rubicundulus Ve08.2h10 TaxID=930991 RepID=A0A0D0E856_9AGAM|nr:hypothetical protein PAXRUDRAFT_827804 [Paxillus rubicundulus Ve08.2h10]